MEGGRWGTERQREVSSNPFSVLNFDSRQELTSSTHATDHAHQTNTLATASTRLDSVCVTSHLYR
jgi:hypothetical protein